jgi:hypothetical protein
MSCFRAAEIKPGIFPRWNEIAAFYNDIDPLFDHR